MRLNQASGITESEPDLHDAKVYTRLRVDTRCIPSSGDLVTSTYYKANRKGSNILENRQS